MLRSRQLRAVAIVLRHQYAHNSKPLIGQFRNSICQIQPFSLGLRYQVTAATAKPNELRKNVPEASFDVAKMTELLDHDNHEMRKQFRQFVSDPVMIPKYNIPLAEERDLSLKRLQRICDAGFISVLDFRSNPHRIFAAHELASIIDPAMTVKMTVQFNLFGGTVLKLGTERHHSKLLKGKTYFIYIHIVRIPCSMYMYYDDIFTNLKEK